MRDLNRIRFALAELRASRSHLQLPLRFTAFIWNPRFTDGPFKNVQALIDSASLRADGAFAQDHEYATTRPLMRKSDALIPLLPDVAYHLQVDAVHARHQHPGSDHTH